MVDETLPWIGIGECFFGSGDRLGHAIGERSVDQRDASAEPVIQRPDADAGAPCDLFEGRTKAVLAGSALPLLIIR